MSERVTTRSSSSLSPSSSASSSTISVLGAALRAAREAAAAAAEAATDAAVMEAPELTDLPVDGGPDKAASKLSEKSINFDIGEDSDEEGVTLANSFRPSAIGLSFLADLSQELRGIIVELISIFTFYFSFINKICH